MSFCIAYGVLASICDAMHIENQLDFTRLLLRRAVHLSGAQISCHLLRVQCQARRSFNSWTRSVSTAQVGFSA
ncbi:hypothetical protein BS50DRAFT_273828 [Corynespora cassiicola Philippines]|uniref:Uncharacterized protein n=1 Tax=Corynespora cassiicola Philippines TaxID=1448308 RepID=A0A2T2P0P5_CORCC|nr:hypothetical protein BS50DRAFT_273828 [Corynespora cassiicola Philippines]